MAVKFKICYHLPVEFVTKVKVSWDDALYKGLCGWLSILCRLICLLVMPPPLPIMTMQLACASAWLPTDTCEPLLWREPTHLGLSNKLCTQPCPDQGCNDANSFFFLFLCFVGGLNGAPPMLSFRPASCARWIRNRIERKEGIDTLHQPCSFLQTFYVLSVLLICIVCLQMFCGNQNQRTLCHTCLENATTIVCKASFWGFSPLLFFLGALVWHFSYCINRVPLACFSPAVLRCRAFGCDLYCFAVVD